MKRKYLREILIRTDFPIPKDLTIIQVIEEETIERKNYKDIKSLRVWAIVEVDKG